MNKFGIVLSLFLSLSGSDAFSATSSPRSTTTSLEASRRAFLDGASVMGIAFLGGAMPAFAEGFDDLSMPSEAEQKAADDAMQERLRKKAELKAAAAKPKTYVDSVAAERVKKANMDSLSKEERRDRLCEELGRGC